MAQGATSGDPSKLEVRFVPEWISWLPPDRDYLWVLSRKPQADPRVVDALLDYAGTLGFPVGQVTRSGN